MYSKRWMAVNACANNLHGNQEEQMESGATIEFSNSGRVYRETELWAANRNSKTLKAKALCRLCVLCACLCVNVCVARVYSLQSCILTITDKKVLCVSPWWKGTECICSVPVLKNYFDVPVLALNTVSICTASHLVSVIFHLLLII